MELFSKRPNTLNLILGAINKTVPKLAALLLVGVLGTIGLTFILV